jgi:hypothetical protein
MPAAFILEEVLNTLRKVLHSANTLLIFRGILADPAVARMQWAQLHNGRSGRTARQFMDFLTAELKLAKET